jgi:formylmethanofuran dehydrogenase subunit E
MRYDSRSARPADRPIVKQEGSPMDATAGCLERLAGLHRHLCPRQVLGVRAGLYAAGLLGLPVPQRDKRLLAIVETDGCFTSGVSVATGCALGHRTLRLVDHGKAALTLVDTLTERAVRVWPQPEARRRALAYALDVPGRWHAQLAAYQVMPVEELLCARPVALALDLAALISRPGLRVACAGCGEEIMNGREVLRDGRPLCRGCAGDAYYRALDGPAAGAGADGLPAAAGPARPAGGAPG